MDGRRPALLLEVRRPMVFLRNLLGQKQAPAPKSEAEPEAIPPARLLKQDFDFDKFDDLQAAEAQQKVESGEVEILDVRFEYEYRTHHIPGAILIPLPQLPARYQQLDPSRPTLVVCEHGIRSLQACSFLSSRGFWKLYNMVGGMSVYPGKQDGDREDSDR